MVPPGLNRSRPVSLSLSLFILHRGMGVLPGLPGREAHPCNGSLWESQQTENFPRVVKKLTIALSLSRSPACLIHV